MTKYNIDWSQILTGCAIITTVVLLVLILKKVNKKKESYKSSGVECVLLTALDNYPSIVFTDEFEIFYTGGDIIIDTISGAGKKIKWTLKNYHWDVNGDVLDGNNNKIGQWIGRTTNTGRAEITVGKQHYLLSTTGQYQKDLDKFRSRFTNTYKSICQ